MNYYLVPLRLLSECVTPGRLSSGRLFSTLRSVLGRGGLGMSNSVGMASFRRFFLRLKVPLSAGFMNWSAVKWFSHKASCVILPRSRFKFRSSRRVLIHHLWHLCTEKQRIYKEMHTVGGGLVGLLTTALYARTV